MKSVAGPSKMAVGGWILVLGAMAIVIWEKMNSSLDLDWIFRKTNTRCALESCVHMMALFRGTNLLLVPEQQTPKELVENLIRKWIEKSVFQESNLMFLSI